MTQTLPVLRSQRSVRIVPHRRARPLAIMGLAAGSIAILTCVWLAATALFPGWIRESVKGELNRAGAPASVVQFYARRDYAPLWVGPPGLHPLRLTGSIGPAGRQAQALARPDRRRSLAALVQVAASGRPADLAKAEVALSLGMTDYVDRTWPKDRSSDLAFVDPDLRAPSGPGATLAHAASEPSLARYVAALEEVNPVYRRLSQGLSDYRSKWSRLPQVQVPEGPALELGAQGERVRLLRTRLGLPGSQAGADRFDAPLAAALERFQRAHGLAPTGKADGSTVAALNAGFKPYEQLILANLERARSLPPTTANRFILVNVPAAQLSYYQDGLVRGQMRVVVGAPQAQTPTMAGVVRYVVFNPFWNVPVDLVRSSIAPKVLKSGPGYFRAAHLQALSDWTDTATEVDPYDIDWRGVAGGKDLRVRQWPGGDNMMGRVKFMLPNELGIYLHDTPNKEAFSRAERLMSAGCIRLERASELVEWLLSDRRPSASPAPDQQVDLAEPTPVYITYLTAAPGKDGIAFYPDVYRRLGGRVPSPLTGVSGADRASGRSASQL